MPFEIYKRMYVYGELNKYYILLLEEAFSLYEQKRNTN